MPTRAFSSEVDTGSREENASKKVYGRSALWKILAHRDFGGIAGRQDLAVKRRLALRKNVVQRDLLDRLGQQLPDAVRQRAVVDEIRRLAGDPLIPERRPLFQVRRRVIGNREAFSEHASVPAFQRS